MCNCKKTTICSNCSNGSTCQCPPDYSVMPLPVECGCCPDGYTWEGPTPNYPNGNCINASGVSTTPIDCNQCEEAISDNCVYISPNSCFGIKGSFTLKQFIEYMCSEAYFKVMLTKVGATQSLLNGWCNINKKCGPPTSTTTPIPGPVSWTIP